MFLKSGCSSISTFTKQAVYTITTRTHIDTGKMYTGSIRSDLTSLIQSAVQMFILEKRKVKKITKEEKSVNK